MEELAFYNISIGPGSMGVAENAIDLFGLDRVDPGMCGGPVWVYGLSYDEVQFAIEFFGELEAGVRIESKV